MKQCLLVFAVAFVLSSLEPRYLCSEPPAWELVKAVGAPTARHEASFVACRDQLFLIGGRRINPVDVFDPRNATWMRRVETPMEMHHFQAVSIGSKIYIVGAMTGPYPRETPLEKVVVFDTETSSFDFVHHIPETRRRGGAGVVVHQDKIYLVGGITNGHLDGTVSWFDCYDPQTGHWDALEDAPHARDHCTAAIAEGRLYALAGRRTNAASKKTFQLTEPAVDVFDFNTNRWLPEQTVPDLPTPRAGNMATSYRGRIYVGGGESGTQKAAHDEVDIFDPKKGIWESGPALVTGRHGSGFAIVDDVMYTAAGSANRGGGPEQDSIERLRL
ncbi:MAG: kelch repeat-containing protein [Planctomycetota bacterium]